MLIFGADHYRDRLPQGGTFVAWDKSCGMGPADSFADAEFAWTNARVKRNVLRYLWKGVACEKAGAGSTLKCNVVVVEEYLAWGQIAESLPWPIV